MDDRVIPIGRVRRAELPEVTLQEMLDGWRNQQLARNLAFSTIENRERIVLQLIAHVNEYPWSWTAAMVDEWLSDRRAIKGHRQSTVRAAGSTIRMFCAYLTDPLYGWDRECMDRFGTHPVQVCHRWNTATHVQEADGSPRTRPFTRHELQDFFDAADSLVADARTRGHKGWWPAFRDATLFKMAYAYGLRVREATMVDVADLSPNPSAAEFGRFGVVAVRYGKAMRGSPPKRRSVLTVWDWTPEVLSEWVTDIRPCRSPRRHRGPLWPSERGNSAVGAASVQNRFRDIRRRIGLDQAVTFHSFRRSYVTHLIEDGFDAKFVQDQVGHEHASTTSLYTAVSSDFRTRTLRAALDATIAKMQTADTGRKP